MQERWKGNVMLLLAAFIWGTAFVAQSAGMEFVQPLTYNGIRTLIGAVVLIPVIFFFDRRRDKEQPVSAQEKKEIRRNSTIGGFWCGIALCIAGNLQQFGMDMTTAGKAGFITSLYIVIVPLLGIFLKRKIPKIVWVSVAIAVIGFYLLCFQDDFSISRGDLLILCCAFFFSVHIMTVDHFSLRKIDGVRMSCVQFFTSGTITVILMFLFEQPTLSAIWAAKITILYAGIMSSGVAFTLQILGQKYTAPATATLLMSLESVFAALSGWALLHERLSIKELCGCALVFAAVLLAQLPAPAQKSE